MMLQQVEAPGAATLGKLPDGSTVRELQIGAGELSAAVLTFGAVLRELRFGGVPVTLGYDRLQRYVSGAAYVGAVAGRYANRIAEGRFHLDGQAHQLSRNENGRTHLHGGVQGFSHTNWSLLSGSPTGAVLLLRSADGDEGYPGGLTARCAYRIEPPATLSVDLEAVTDRTTIVNLALHSYFNLGAAASIADHLLEIPADFFLPVTAEKIPMGVLAPVAGTVFDFRAARRIGRGHFDHNFVVARESPGALRTMAKLTNPGSGICLEIRSTEPGLQFYDGHMLDERKDGFAPYAGIALEPQRFPNSPNEPSFPSAVLQPGEVYRQRTEYRFTYAPEATR